MLPCSRAMVPVTERSTLMFSYDVWSQDEIKTIALYFGQLPDTAEEGLLGEVYALESNELVHPIGDVLSVMKFGYIVQFVTPENKMSEPRLFSRDRASLLAALDCLSNPPENL